MVGTQIFTYKEFDGCGSLWMAVLKFSYRRRTDTMQLRYKNTQPVKMWITGRERAFLRHMALTLGLSLSEFLRRILEDTLDRYIEAGLYPPPAHTLPRQPAAEKESVAITFRRGSDGRVTVAYPDGLSESAQAHWRDAMQAYIPEFTAFLASMAKGPVTGNGTGPHAGPK
jgi:hypothetical protein